MKHKKLSSPGVIFYIFICISRRNLFLNKQLTICLEKSVKHLKKIQRGPLYIDPGTINILSFKKFHSIFQHYVRMIKKNFYN